MKRQSKAMLSFLLAFSMLVSVFAGTAARKTVAEAAVTAEVLTPTHVTDWFATPSSTPRTMNLPGKNGNAAADAESTAVIVPIKMDYAGVLNLGVAAKATTGAGITAAVYQDANCTQMMENSFNIDSASQAYSYKSYSMSAAGTFYLKVKWLSAVPEQGTDIAVIAEGFSDDEITLGNDYKLVWTYDKTVTKYHKLVVKSDSVVTLEGYAIKSSSARSGLSFNICDKNKKQLRSITFSSSNQYGDYVALKKGTYYVAVQTDYPYQLRSASLKVKDQGGASKKKAKTIKKKQTVKGIVSLSEGTGKADWYKFKLKKRSKLKLTYAALCTGTSSLKLQVIPASKKSRLSGDTTVYMKDRSGGLSSRTTIAKGTYYLKVTKPNKVDNGYYAIKYVK